MSRRAPVTSCTLCFLFLLASCGGQAPQEAQTDPTPDEAPAELAFNLLAKLPLADGQVIELYEPEPGRILIAETGPAGANPVLTRLPGGRRIRPSSIYALLAPEQQVPPRVLEAERRAVARAEAAARAPRSAGAREGDGGTLSPGPQAGDPGQQLPLPEPRGAVDGVGSLQQALSGSCPASWFNNEFCSTWWDWELCLLNHWNGAFSWCTNTMYFLSAVCADIGHILFRVKTNTGKGGVWTVLQGTYRYYWVFCGSSFPDPCDEFRMDTTVEHATNDRFHFHSRCDFDD